MPRLIEPTAHCSSVGGSASAAATSAVPAVGQVGEQLDEVLGQRLRLLLLALHRDLGALGEHLEVEDPPAGLADGARR